MLDCPLNGVQSDTVYIPEQSSAHPECCQGCIGLARLLDLYEMGDLDRETYRERKSKLDKEQSGVSQLHSELEERLKHAHRSRML